MWDNQQVTQFEQNRSAPRYDTERVVVPARHNASITGGVGPGKECHTQFPVRQSVSRIRVHGRSGR